MKKTGLLIVFIVASVSLFVKMNFQVSELFDHDESISNGGLVGDAKPNIRLKDDSIEKSESYVKSSIEIKHVKLGLGARFETSDDLYALALELYDLANSDNREAQFYLAKAMLYCHSPDIPSSEYDSALTLELYDWMRTRCAGFVNQNLRNLGDADHWLKLSAEAKFPQAVIVSLMMKDDIPRTQSVLKNIQLALSSNNSEVMYLMGSIGHPQKNRLANEAWRFLACDYGHDCSAQSKSIWRLGVGSICSLKLMVGQECTSDLDYISFRKGFYTSAELEEIMAKVELLNGIIKSGKISELTFEQILE